MLAIQALQPVSEFISVAQYGTDRNLFVEFYDEMVHQAFKSESAGIPIYEAVPHIHMVYSGGKSDFRRKVKLEDDNASPSDPHRFPRQWEAFKANQEQSQPGTPLEMMPWLKKEQIFGLKAQHVTTVEQLANLPDSSMAIMGQREMRDRAQKYLAVASGDHAVVSALEAKNAALQTDIDALKAQFAELAASQRRGPGRPRREDSNAEG